MVSVPFTRGKLPSAQKNITLSAVNKEDRNGPHLASEIENANMRYLLPETAQSRDDPSMKRGAADGQIREDTFFGNNPIDSAMGNRPATRKQRL